MMTDKVKTLMWEIVFTFLSLSEAVYIAISPASREGLEYLWLLPAAFGICVLWGNRIIRYQKGSIGIKTYFVIAIIRFLIQPMLITLSGGKVSSNRMSIVDPSAYRIATIIECIEIIIVTVTVYYYYPKCLKRYLKKVDASRIDGNYYGGYNCKVNLGIKRFGWIVLGLLISILIIRINIWFPALKIHGIKGSSDQIVVLENSFFSCVKTVLFVYCLYRAIVAERKRVKFRKWFFLTLVSGVLCCITSFGSNRSFTVETIVTILVILLLWFPKYRLPITISIIPLSIIIITMMIIVKQFGVENMSEISETSLGIQYVSNQLEEYTNGPWCIAQSYSSSIGLSSKDSWHALVKDIISGMEVIFDIPGLKGLDDFASSWQSSSDIMKMSFELNDRGQMLSFSGGFFICFGTFGWLIFPFATVICTMIMTWFSIHGSYENNIFKQYIFLWSAFLFGLMHCYCMQTLIYCMTKYVAFLWLIVIGSKFRIGK